MKKLILAVDFDGTIAESRWPEIGDPLPGAIDTMNHLHRQGHKIIIWTCRTGLQLNECIHWLHRHNVHYDDINNNLPERIKAFGGDTRKVSADLYVDDKAVGMIGMDKRMMWYHIKRTVDTLAGR